MAISVSDEMRAWLDERQRTKCAAIRENPIYDKELFLPIRGTKIRCLEFIPTSEGCLPAVFDVHGGGFTNGYPEEDDLICRRICDELQVRVFSIDYRLAPDYPFPEGQLDVYEAISYIVTNAEAFGVDPERIAACGHSAGGNLVLGSALRAVESGAFALKGLILDYPSLDMATPPAEKFFIEGCIPIALSDLFNACYMLPEQSRDFLCSPCFAPDEMLRRLPPVTMLSCEIDSLRVENEALAARLVSLGVEVTARRFLGQAHAFNVKYDNPAAMESISLMVRSLRSYLSPGNSRLS